MTHEVRKGIYASDAPLPRSAPPPVPVPPLSGRGIALYDGNPEALLLRSAFPTSSSLVVDGIKVAIVDYKDPHDPLSPASKREWNAFVYSLSPPVNFQPFDSRRMLMWWLRSDEGIAAVREAWVAGQGPQP
jgi:hypothetical protein